MEMNMQPLKFVGDTFLNWQQVTWALAHYFQQNAVLLKSVTTSVVNLPYQNGVIAPRMQKLDVNRTQGGNPVQAITPDGVSVLIDKYASVDLAFDTYNLYPAEDMVKMYIQPATATLALEVEKEIANMFEQVPFLYTFPDSNNISYQSLAAGLMTLENRGVYTTSADCSLVLHNHVVPNILNLTQITGLPMDSHERTRTTSNMGEILGFNTSRSPILTSHIAGVTASPLGVTIASPLNIAGSSMIAISVVGGGTLNKGDVIQIAGGNMQYSVAANISAGAGGVFTLQITPPLQESLPANLGVMLLLKTGYNSIALSRKAACVAFLELPLLSTGDGGGRYWGDTSSGLSLRLRRFINDAGSLILRVEVKYGMRLVNPELATLLR